ncbi:MAG: radical SAM protein, partial [Bacteroidaceae bacterium]|nr:radical SAM protein [Bacteroidaceae bacterium]
MLSNTPKLKRFIDLYVPVTTCTLHCHYCYIYHQGLFKNKLPEFKYSPEVVKRALSQKRLGGTCLINMCGGGETLLPPQVTDYIKVLLENGHYVMVVTNGTVTKRFEEISQFPKELLSRLFFKFSYHYLELKRKKLFDTFFGNIKLMRDCGCSFTLELTPNDESIPYINDIKQLAIEQLGAACHVTIARDDVSPLADKPILTKLPHDEFYKVWGVFVSDMMAFKRTIFGQKRREFCYAGDWSFYLNLGTGIKTQCYSSFKSQQIFENPEEPIDFTPVG